MSNIRLFPADWPQRFTITESNNSTIFSGLGLGKITDAISCTVTEERNGLFELEMQYPVTGIRYSQLAVRMLIVAPPNPYDDPQAFRIYSISKQYGGKVKIKAQHISYDLSNVMMKKGEISDDALNPSKIWSYVNSHLTNGFSLNAANTDFQYTFKSNLTINDAIDDSDGNKTKKWVLKGPKSVRNILMGNSEDGLTKLYSVENKTGEEPEFRFNNFVISLNKERGSNRGIRIKYGKNMKGFTQEESVEKIYTHVYPFYYASSITYYEGGFADGNQITLNDWACDLTDWTAWPSQTSGNYAYDATNPALIDTGLRDDDGNKMPFKNILPLDISSLYKGDYGINLEELGQVSRYDLNCGLHIVGHDDGNNKFSKDETVHMSMGCSIGDWALRRLSRKMDQFGQYILTKDDLSHFQLDDYEYGFSIADGYSVVIYHGWDPGYATVQVTGDVTNNSGEDWNYSELGDIFQIVGDGEVWNAASYYYDLTKSEDVSKIAARIRKPTLRYIQENHLSRFPVQLTVDMALAEPTNIKSLYDIRLCDTIMVLYPSFNVTTVAKCTKTTYNCLTDKYTKLDFSNSWSGLAFRTSQNIDNTKRSFASYNYIDAKFGHIRFLAGG